MEASAQLSDIFRAIDLIGVLINGILGGRLARQKHFDAIGFMVLAVLSALAGGILRDLILSAGPPIAITDPYYLPTAIIGAGVAMLWKLESKWSSRIMLVGDGIVLGTWAATGAAKTLAVGYGMVPALLLGLTTAVGGGMIRDIAAGTVPRVFGGNTLYATPALVSAAIMVGFYQAGYQQTGMVVAASTGALFTMISYWRKWTLPRTHEWTITLTSNQLRRALFDNKKYQSKPKKFGPDDERPQPPSYLVR